MSFPKQNRICIWLMNFFPTVITTRRLDSPSSEPREYIPVEVSLHSIRICCTYESSSQDIYLCTHFHYVCVKIHQYFLEGCSKLYLSVLCTQQPTITQIYQTFAQISLHNSVCSCDIRNVRPCCLNAYYYYRQVVLGTIHLQRAESMNSKLSGCEFNMQLRAYSSIQSMQ